MSKKKILIVDFDIKSLESLSELFENHNVEIITARDGVTAFEKFQSENPDLVILEPMLPRLHGFDLTQKINKESKGKVPVIIVTGVYKGHQYRNEAIRNFGAVGYFEKPFDKDKLLDAVMKYVQDEGDVEEDMPDLPDLPGAESVIQGLAQRLKKKPPDKKE
jgi:two-component system OmpR family response regulator